MHDIKLLEESWIRYHKAKRKPYYFALFFMIISVGVFYLIKISHLSLSFFKDANTTTSIKKSSLAHVVLEEANPFLCNKPILIIENVKKNLKEEPLIPVIEQMETSIFPIAKDIPIVEDIEHKKRVFLPKKEKNPKVTQDKNKHFNIKKVSSKHAYREVEKRFYQFHDVDDALFLARVYYSNGEYKKAEKWALKTNKLNNTLEESWIIFSKSKIKLGHLDEAKHILSKYIKQSNSQKAKILLYKLRK